MATRNHLFLFAWLCAIVVPVALQWLSGTLEEVRDYLAYYYGPLSLYMFFAMSFGFCTVFVSFYQISGCRRAGTVDLLRVSGVKPWEVLSGVILQLQVVLLPPLLGFLALFMVIVSTSSERSQFLSLGWLVLFGTAINFIINEIMLVGLICLAMLPVTKISAVTHNVSMPI